VRIEKIVCTVLNDAHEQQVKEVMYTLSEGPGSSTGKALSFRRNPLSLARRKVSEAIWYVGVRFAPSARGHLLILPEAASR
jgi:hypothetical protein